MSTSIEQIWNLLASRPKFVFSPTFIFCSPICPNNCGVVFFVKIYFSFREMFSFVRPLKYAIFTMNITRVVTSFNEFTWLSVFLSTESFFYHLNLIPCHYWSWQRNIYFLVNNFIRHTFSMSKSSIKTKTWTSIEGIVSFESDSKCALIRTSFRPKCSSSIPIAVS